MLSFLLPTKRYNTNRDVFEKCIKSIHRHHSDTNYEILVYSPDLVDRDDIVYVQEKEFGPISGFNYLSSIARGDYLVCITDDHMFLNNTTACIEKLETRTGKVKITGLTPGGPCYIPQRGDLLGDKNLSIDVKRVQTLRFPVIHRESLKYLDYNIFHNSLTYHAGDIWLAFYLSEIGEEATEGPTFIREIMPLKDSTYEVSDCNKVRKLIENFDPSLGYLQ
jgi:hypothetical protein